jgi:hypothetical protein
MNENDTVKVLSNEDKLSCAVRDFAGKVGTVTKVCGHYVHVRINGRTTETMFRNSEVFKLKVA